MKVLAYGEVMLRLRVEDYNLLSQSNRMIYSFGGTGFNVLSGLENFGISSSLLSFLPDNNLGKSAQGFIASLGVGCEHTYLTPGHLGSYIIEVGTGYRGSQVTYMDRSLSSFNTTILEDQKISKALEGVSHLHLCGIALSTSKTSLNNVLKLADAAKEKGIQIIFDFNYRPRLNQYAFHKAAYEQVLRKADIVLGSPYDVMSLMELDTSEDVLEQFMNQYDIKIFAGTLKDKNQYQGFVMQGKKMIKSQAYTIQHVIEPIGTGDAFASRLIAGILKEESLDIAVEKVTISGLIAHTISGDVVLVSEAMIDSFVPYEYVKVMR